MSTERRKILDMLAAGTIAADEADELLKALDEKKSEDVRVLPAAEPDKGRTVKFLNVHVIPSDGKDIVNVRIPIMLIKAGLKIKGIVPEGVQAKVEGALGQKGFDVDLKNMDSAQLDAFLEALSETSIDVMSDDEVVKIFCD